MPTQVSSGSISGASLGSQRAPRVITKVKSKLCIKLRIFQQAIERYRVSPSQLSSAVIQSKQVTQCAAQQTFLEIETMLVQLTVNGKPVQADVPDNTLLVQMIRDTVHLTGTHVGCDTSQCGACTVMMNGNAVKSCSVLAASANGADIGTIEGLAQQDGTLHPMQAAFKECHGLQCGYCTPGMVMSSIDLVNKNPDASEQEIRASLEGNICRCTGYQNIVRAVQSGRDAMMA